VYDPNRPDEYAAILSQVQADITAAVGSTSTENPAIQLTSMGEGASFFGTAIDSVPELRNVAWFGSDGFVGDWSVLRNPELAEFAIDVDYTAPTYRVEVPERFRDVIERIECRTGVTPGSYSLLTYDATRVAARTLSLVGNHTSYEELETTLKEVMDQYIGVSGWLQMDVMGDRYDGNYDFYTIRTDGWEYWWERIEPSSHQYE
jgi:hypothetical protein